MKKVFANQNIINFIQHDIALNSEIFPKRQYFFGGKAVVGMRKSNSKLQRSETLVSRVFKFFKTVHIFLNWISFSYNVNIHFKR